MEYVNCDLCGADNAEFLFYDNSFKLVRCRGCGLVYANPRPMEFVVDEICPGRRTGRDPHFSYYKNYIAHKNGFAAEAKDFLKGIKKYKKRGRLLDIGSAAGFFLNEARKNGWETYGVEISPALSGYARDKFGLNVFCGALEESCFAEGYFDAITMFDLLSHLRSPAGTLMEIRRVLATGGLLVIKGGNKGELKTKRAGGESWGSPDHLYHFSRKNIRELLKRSGFKILELKSEAVMGSLFNRKSLEISGNSKTVNFIEKHKTLLAGPYRLFRKTVRSLLGRFLGYFPVDSIVMVYAIKE